MIYKINDTVHCRLSRFYFAVRHSLPLLLPPPPPSPSRKGTRIIPSPCKPRPPALDSIPSPPSPTLDRNQQAGREVRDPPLPPENADTLLSGVRPGGQGRPRVQVHRFLRLSGQVSPRGNDGGGGGCTAVALSLALSTSVLDCTLMCI